MKIYIFILLIIMICLASIIVLRPLLNQYTYSLWRPRTQRKIFGIGIGRTATSSLSLALIKLGLKTWHAPAMISRNNIQNYINKFDALTDLWSVTDITYKELYDLYPNALYILTIRDPDTWLKSTQYYKKLATISNMIPGYKEMQTKIKLISKTYFETYNTKVIEFFKDKPEKLLVLNIPKGDGWGKLCKFLEISYNENESFPHISEILLHCYQCLLYLIP